MLTKPPKRRTCAIPPLAAAILTFVVYWCSQTQLASAWLDETGIAFCNISSNYSVLPINAGNRSSMLPRMAPSRYAIDINVGVLVGKESREECEKLRVVTTAAQMANRYLARLKRPSRLRFFFNVTNSTIGGTMMALYSFLHNNQERAGRPVDYILGPVRDNIIKAVIEVSMFRHIPVISYAQTSPLTLSPVEYSSLIRVGLTTPDYHWTVAKLIRAFNWTHVTLVISSRNSTDDTTDLRITHFHHVAKVHGIVVAHTIKIPFLNNKMLLASYDAKLLNSLFYRVVVAFLDSSEAINLLCQLDRQFSALHWIFVGSFPRRWLMKGSEASLEAFRRCRTSSYEAIYTKDENNESFIDSSFVIDTNRADSPIRRPGGVSSYLFRPAICRRPSDRRFTWNHEMKQAWDSVWLLAASILHKYQWQQYITSPLDSDQITEDQQLLLIPKKYGIVSTEDYPGSHKRRSQKSSNSLVVDCLSGPVIIEDGARRPLFHIHQIQNKAMVPVLTYQPLSDRLVRARCRKCRPFSWRMGHPPKDKIVEHIERHTTPLWVSALVFTATGCGAILAISFFVFTIVYRRERIIKLSAPSLTGIFAIGSAMLYLLLPFLSHSASIYSGEWNLIAHYGTDEVGGESVTLANLTCLIRYLLLFCGFSCTFCSVALRTYKIYIATTSLGPTDSKTERMFRDERPLIVVAFCVVLDIVLVGSWSLVVGFEFHEQNETKYYNIEMDRLITYQSVECSTQHATLFFAICCSWKLLLISFGLFMAWRIHGVKIRILNDSKFIGAISYIIVISALLVGIIHIVGISHSGVATYLLDVAIVICANTICLLLNFLPKVIAVKRRESAILSDVFIDQGGTRRLNAELETEHITVQQIETQNALLRGELTKLTLRAEQLDHFLSLEDFGSLETLRSAEMAAEQKGLVQNPRRYTAGHRTNPNRTVSTVTNRYEKYKHAAEDLLNPLPRRRSSPERLTALLKKGDSIDEDAMSDDTQVRSPLSPLSEIEYVMDCQTSTARLLKDLPASQQHGRIGSIGRPPSRSKRGDSLDNDSACTGADSCTSFSLKTLAEI